MRALTKAEIVRVRRRLEELAIEYGSQLQASAKVGIAQQRYNQICNGEPLGLYVARKLAKHDGVPLEFVLDSGTPCLEGVIVSNRSRWSPWTIAAVFRVAQLQGDRGRDGRAWAAMLDELEHTIGPIVARPPSKAL